MASNWPCRCSCTRQLLLSLVCTRVCVFIVLRSTSWLPLIDYIHIKRTNLQHVVSHWCFLLCLSSKLSAPHVDMMLKNWQRKAFICFRDVWQGVRSLSVISLAGSDDMTEKEKEEAMGFGKPWHGVEKIELADRRVSTLENAHDGHYSVGKLPSLTPQCVIMETKSHAMQAMQVRPSVGLMHAWSLGRG